jgi:hypothetical protein
MHARHIHVSQLRELGVKVFSLEDDPKLQDAVLTVHHACINTFQQTHAVKIIENQNDIAFITQAIPQIALPIQQAPVKANDPAIVPVNPPAEQ